MLKLATPAAADAGTYEGGHVSHTGQLYFDDAINDEVFETAEAYAGRDNTQRLRNDQDGILNGYADEPGFIMALTPLGEDALVDGFLGEITIGSIRPPRRNRPDSGAALRLGTSGPPPGGPGGPPPMNLRQTVHRDSPEDA